MKFRSFLENKQHFEINGADVIITEEIDTNLLKFINNRVKNFVNKITPLLKPGDKVPLTPQAPLKKFRISIKYPRNTKASKLGHYHPETMYVFAVNSHQAKAKAEQHIRSKGKPYLKDLKRMYMGTKASAVKTWKDLTILVKHLAETKSVATPLLYLGDEDFQVLVNQAKKKTFIKDIKKLDSKEQRILKSFFYKMMPKELPKEVIKNIKKLSTREASQERLPGDDDPEFVDWNGYWSVFEPRSDEEENKLLSNINSLRELFNAGYKFGITPKDLRDVKEELFGAQNKRFSGIREMWKELRNQLYNKHNLSHRNKIFQTSDYTNPLLYNKYGIEWDLLAREWMSGVYSGEEDYFPFSKERGANDFTTEKQAMQWLWEFYKNGLPPKVDTLKQYKTALDYLLEQRNKNEDVPF